MSSLKGCHGERNLKITIILIKKARELYADDDFGLQLDKAVYVLDTTIIDLCLSLFPWAHFRRTKAAIKLHTLLDLRYNIPSFIAVGCDGSTYQKRVDRAKQRTWHYCRESVNSELHCMQEIALADLDASKKSFMN